MINFRTYLTLPETQMSHLSSNYAFLSTTAQTIAPGIITSNFSSSQDSSTQFSSWANNTTTDFTSSTGSTFNGVGFLSRTDGIGNGSNSTHLERGSTVSSTRNLNSSGATTWTSSSTSNTFSNFTAGTGSSSSDSSSGSTTAGSTGTTFTTTQLVPTSINGSLSRNYTSISTATTEYTYVSIESSISGTVEATGTSTRSSTATASHSTTFPGYYATTNTSATVTVDFLGALFGSYTANVIKAVDFSSINEWMFIPSVTTSNYRLVTDIASSTDSTYVGTGGTSGQVRHTSDISYTAFSLSVVRNFTDANITSTFSTSYTAQDIDQVTLTYHITTNTATRTYTTFTYYSTLPFPTSSSGTATENAQTLTTTTATGHTIRSISATSLFATVNNLGAGAMFADGALRTLSTVTFSTRAATTTQTISTLLTYHSSLRSLVTATTTGLSTISYSQGVTMSASFVNATLGYSIITNVSNGTSSHTTSQFMSRVSDETRSFVTWLGFSNNGGVPDSSAGSLQGSISPRALTGFRNIAAPLYSDSYGTVFDVGISNSTKILFPILSFEQRHSIYLPVAYSTDTLTETGSVSWTGSFTSNSIFATFSNTVSSFTATDTDLNTFLTNSTTVTATWSVVSSLSDSTSYFSTTFPVTGTSTLSTRSITKRLSAFGGIPDASTVPQGLMISKGAYLETIRPHTGGVETTTSISLDCASSRFSSAATTNINILDPATVVRATNNAAFPYITTAKWIY